MPERVYLGIDPGLDGAVAIIRDGAVLLHDTPTVRGATKREYAADAMADLLRPYAGHAMAVLEAVSGRPGQGGASARSTGLGYGLWLGILAALEIAREPAYPHVWKRQYQLIGADKAASRARAAALYPAVRDELRLVRHHGRAEALLLADYARRRDGRGER